MLVIKDMSTGVRGYLSHLPKGRLGGSVSPPIGSSLCYEGRILHPSEFLRSFGFGK